MTVQDETCRDPGHMLLDDHVFRASSATEARLERFYLVAVGHVHSDDANMVETVVYAGATKLQLCRHKRPDLIGTLHSHNKDV